MKQDWEYGTILSRSRHGQIVMFVCWDRDRTREMGGGERWFKGMLVERMDALMGDFGPKPGEIGNYAATGFREVRA